MTSFFKNYFLNEKFSLKEFKLLDLSGEELKNAENVKKSFRKRLRNHLDGVKEGSTGFQLWRVGENAVPLRR